MGEILGIGVTHQPTLSDAELRPMSFMKTLEDPDLPEHLRTADGWPDALRAEWSDDEGRAAGRAHHEAIRREFGVVRKALDEFAPDVLVVWGDDQYERFREDCVPPFCVIADDEFRVKPWEGRAKPNVWGEPESTEVRFAGSRSTAVALTEMLLRDDFDVSYSYRSDRPLGHAFVNTVMYLDWERRGFPYPVVPFSVNCYGRFLTVAAGARVPLRAVTGDTPLDPPAPSPGRCFALGRATARALASSDLRVAIVASSSWSHGFLTRKHSFLYPDVEADRRLYEHLAAGDLAEWERMGLDAIEESGQQEMLNWFCLAGAIAELDLQPEHLTFVESHIFNSSKVFAVLR